MCLTKQITPTYNLKIVGKYECPISKVFHHQDLRELIFNKQMLIKNLEQQITIAKNNHQLSMEIIEKLQREVEWNDHIFNDDDFLEYLRTNTAGDKYICEECGVGCIASVGLSWGRSIKFIEPMDFDGLMFRCKCCNWKEEKADRAFYKSLGR